MWDTFQRKSLQNNTRGPIFRDILASSTGILLRVAHKEVFVYFNINALTMMAIAVIAEKCLNKSIGLTLGSYQCQLSDCAYHCKRQIT